MIINNNISAINTRNQLFNTNAASSKSMEKLSSGKRINRAADDAAGLSISEKMRAQIRGLNQASRNAQDGISLIQTAEGALDEVSNMLVRLKELAVQKANGTYNSEDISNLELEMASLGDEIDNIFDNTKFNGSTVLTSAATIIISDDGTTALTIGATTTTSITGLGSGSVVTTIETAIKNVNKARATYGAKQNRLESTVRNLKTTAENLQAAESRIRDTDMAEEMSTFTKNNILIQAGTAMLAQANMAPQNVLSLLR
ncbi:MAG: flagellin [Clostridiaceae bacterium]|nr:flagellin [Clostridiaceae bacterium]